MRPNASISKLPVVFRRVIKKHRSKVTKRVHYKVLANLDTKAGKQRLAYWFSDGKSFLRQRGQTTGKPLLRIGCSRLQRMQIRKLVKRFNAAG